MSYIKDDDKKPAYDILLAVLESIGCKLFQCQQQWFVIGLNRINDDVVLFHKYQNSNILKLEFVEEVTLTRSIVKKVFEASPSITVIPPLKKMTTTWDAENEDNLIPEDVVTHLPVNIETDIEDRTPKYWSLQTDKDLRKRTCTQS